MQFEPRFACLVIIDRTVAKRLSPSFLLVSFSWRNSPLSFFLHSTYLLSPCLLQTHCLTTKLTGLAVLSKKIFIHLNEFRTLLNIKYKLQSGIKAPLQVKLPCWALRLQWFQVISVSFIFHVLGGGNVADE